MSNELTPRQLLVQARNLILDPAHWHQGELVKGLEIEQIYWPEGYAELPTGAGVCALGALDFGAPLSARGWASDDDLPAYRLRAQQYLCRGMGLSTTLAGIPSWNDATERTHAEVIDAFDRAILLAATDERVELSEEVSDVVRTEIARDLVPV